LSNAKNRADLQGIIDLRNTLAGLQSGLAIAMEEFAELFPA
jgi:hypothetical protein